LFGSDDIKPFFSCVAEGNLLSVSGEVDLNTAQTLHKALVESARQLGKLPILDFNGVSYFDSSGVKVLVEVHSAFSPHTEQPRIIGVQPNVLRVMTIVGLRELYKIESGNSHEK